MAATRGRGRSRYGQLRDARGRFARTGQSARRATVKAYRSPAGKWVRRNSGNIVRVGIIGGYLGTAAYLSIYGTKGSAERYNHRLRKTQRRARWEANKSAFSSSYRNAKDARKAGKAMAKTHGLPAYNRPKVHYDYDLLPNGKLRKKWL